MVQNLKVIDYTKKRLDNMYLVVYTIKNDINIKKGDIIENIDIYTFIGINKRGIWCPVLLIVYPSNLSNVHSRAFSVLNKVSTGFPVR